GEDAVAAVHPAAVDGIETDGANAMKQSLAQSEIVHVRWRCSPHPQLHVARTVHVGAEAGMGLEAAAARQVDHTRGDVVDRGAAVVLKRRTLLARWAYANGRFGNGRFCRRIGSLLLDALIRRQTQTARKHLHGGGETLVER